ncbi:MAG: NAD-dependent succinate-semialdehyde dehydrogenase [Verrucomicrobiia bacterium]
MVFESVNPATGGTLASYPEASGKEVQDCLHAADAASRAWRQTSFPERADLMRKTAALLRQNASDHARLIALEMGKPIKQGRAEVDKCAAACEFYAENAQAFLAPEPVEAGVSKSYVAFEPLGVVLAIMPWNFPFWQAFRCVVPALLAGNAVVLKHASNVPGCALAIEGVFSAAGFPNGLFRSLLVKSSTANSLIEAPVIKAVSLTGSVAAGKAVAAKAGACLKKTVLELGGSDPYVILEDCDLDQTVEACVTSRLINSGQSCIAAKRFIVVEAVRRAFEEAFVARLAKETLGDPLDALTTVGPLAREDLRRQLQSQVERTVASGGRSLSGGRIPPGEGWFYPPTVLTDVRKGMAAFDEETFGPVAAIIPAGGEQEAIALANDSPFGLGAAVFTRDAGRGERIAVSELDAGNCFVNDYVRSDPRLPFGGIKESGYGRELACFGIREFVNVKTVWVK